MNDATGPRQCDSTFNGVWRCILEHGHLELHHSYTVDGTDFRWAHKHEPESKMRNMFNASQELELLRELWDFVWNELGVCDDGKQAVMTYEEDRKLTQLAERVEDYYIEHGFPGRSAE